MNRPLISAYRLRLLAIYDPETGLFTSRVRRRTVTPGKVLGYRHKEYVRIKIDHKDYLAHRLAWFYTHGVWPKDQIDHINQDATDNCLVNLRECTNAENRQNTKSESRSASGYLGVSWSPWKHMWVAQICLHGKNRVIGYYRCATAAYIAYSTEKKKVHLFAMGAPSVMDSLS